MFGFIDKFFTRQTVEIGDILITDIEDPFKQTKIEILDIKNGYALFKYVMLDGELWRTQSTHSGKISRLTTIYTKED